MSKKQTVTIFGTQEAMISHRAELEAAGYIPYSIGVVRKGEDYRGYACGSWMQQNGIVVRVAPGQEPVTVAR